MSVNLKLDSSNTIRLIAIASAKDGLILTDPILSGTSRLTAVGLKKPIPDEPKTYMVYVMPKS
ncbi:hypothetical protein [Coleofasciculus sp. F4-SAH-05]|uniref:hypothetical protein n=1 Tax=Coleofasciculus TaxID=669368 RepID=UPI0003160F2B